MQLYDIVHYMIQKLKILTYHCWIWGWSVMSSSSSSTSTTSMLPASVTSYSSASSSRCTCITTIVVSTRTEGWLWEEWWSPCCRAWGTGVEDWFTEERHTWRNRGDKCRTNWPVEEGCSCRSWLRSDLQVEQQLLHSELVWVACLLHLTDSEHLVHLAHHLILQWKIQHCLLNCRRIK